MKQKQQLTTRKSRIYQSGQALAALVIFSAVGMVVLTATVAAAITSTQQVSSFDRSHEALYIAESGAENALYRILRDPSYTGETLTVGEGTAQITVSGSGPITITATGTVAGFQRTVVVTAGYTNYVLSVTEWQEQF